MPRRNAVEEEKTMARLIGGRLRELRLLNGLNQSQLGAHAGVSFQQVQKFESGNNHVTPWKLVQFANALGVGVDELLGREETPKGEPVSQRRRSVLDAVRGLTEIERESPETFAAICHLIRSQLGPKSRRVRPRSGASGGSKRP